MCFPGGWPTHSELSWACSECRHAREERRCGGKLCCPTQYIHHTYVVTCRADILSSRATAGGTLPASTPPRPMTWPARERVPAFDRDEPLIDIDEARSRVLANISVLPPEDVPLSDALGRTIASDVRSECPIPRFDNSSMDGYALCAEDTKGTAGAPTLDVVDEARAGHPAAATVGRGQAVAIATGAMLPAGANAVVRVEDTRTGGPPGRVSVLAEVELGQNVRRVGEDIAEGSVVLSQGVRIDVVELGVLAALGRTAVSCQRLPEVSLVTSGRRAPMARGASGPRRDSRYERLYAPSPGLPSRRRHS